MKPYTTVTFRAGSLLLKPQKPDHHQTMFFYELVHFGYAYAALMPKCSNLQDSRIFLDAHGK